MASVARVVAAGTRRRMKAFKLSLPHQALGSEAAEIPAVLFSSKGPSSLRFYNTSSLPVGDKTSDYTVPIKTSSLTTEKDFHKVANATLQHLQEMMQAFGKQLSIDGFETDYAEGVLSVRFGDLGTYMINKQIPNRQIWLSSPVRHVLQLSFQYLWISLGLLSSSGPARFDWVDSKWICRRGKRELYDLLKKEFEELHGRPIDLGQ